MALDLHKVANSISAMASDLAESRIRQADRIRGALEVFGSPVDAGNLKEKITSSKTSWLVAEIIDGLNKKYLPSPTPGEFHILATDGSQIDVDRHRGTRCYLINIGTVALKYGSNSEAVLQSCPLLFSKEEDMVCHPKAETPGKELMIEGSLLGIMRTVEEFNYLSGLCDALPEGADALALVDGSLIMWGLLSKDYPDYIVDAVLDNGVLKHMERINQLNPGRRIALASYISFSRSTDVVNALRVLICPHQAADCDRHCTGIAPGKLPCAAMDGITDRDIFGQWLNPDERSEVFASLSKINCSRYGSNRVHFYYIKAGQEIARVEIPQWVARDPKLLSLSHSLVVSQCEKGQGYPVALAEAHEQAVVTGADRENFYRLVDDCLAGKKMPVSVSAKSLSKKTRWV